MTNHLFEFDNLDGWEIWTAPNPPKDLVTPVLNIEDTRRGAHPQAVKNGPTSLRFAMHWSTWHAGISRQFAARPLSLVKLSAWGRIWNNSGQGVFPDFIDTNTHPWLRVGIDKTGGTNPTSASVTWNELKVYGDWKRVEVQEVALQPTVTIFVGFENGRTGQWDLQNMYAFLDTVEVILADDATPPPAGGATSGIESIEDMGTYFRVIERRPKV